MLNEDLEKEVTKLEIYLRKNNRQDFIDEMRNAGPEQLDAKMLSLAKHKEEVANTRARDEELKASKAKTKELNAPYNEQLRMNAKLSRFVSLMMQESE